MMATFELGLVAVSRMAFMCARAASMPLSALMKPRYDEPVSNKED